ncbi:MAG TPA: GYF domain-containing protein, partial [Pirellulales bacterium]|nr:GYF domain-containing protein [Pirellulales bacterium]
MGIRFACNQCGHVLNVKSDLAGKRGICPKCQARFDIPLESTVARRSRRASPTPDDSGGAIASATPHVALSNAGPEAAIASWSPTPAASPAALPLEMAIPAPVIPVPAAAVPDPIVEAPQLLWYVAPSGSTNQYGPASAEMFRGWIQEGRVAADSMVWRQDWSNWLRAGDVLPQLSRSMPVVSVVPA